MLALKLSIQTHDEVAMGAQHALPGSDLVRGQPILTLLRALHAREGSAI